MHTFNSKEIKTNARLHQFIEAKKAFHTIVTDENVNELYRLTIFVPNKAPKPRALCLIEICALLGLTKHFIFLVKHFDMTKQLSRRCYRAYRLAVLNAHLKMFNTMIESCPFKIEEVLKPLNYMIFRAAARSGSLAISKRLVELADDPYKQQMISAHNYAPFKIAVEAKHQDIVIYLLTFPYVFKNLIEEENNIHKNMLIKSFIASQIDFIQKNIQAIQTGSLALSEIQIDLFTAIGEFLVANYGAFDNAQALIGLLLLIPDINHRLQT